VKAQLEKLRSRIDELSLRERALLFLSVVVVLFMFWQALFMAPLENRQKKLLMQIGDLRKETSTLEQQMQLIINRQKEDPDAGIQRQLTQLRSQLSQLDGRISKSVHGLIEPQKIARVLEEVLTRETDLKLVRIKSLGSKPLLDFADEGDTTDAVVGIYRHGMRLEFRGKYLSTLSYLRALQELPWAFYWDDVEITMKKYPVAHVVIDVHTLSLSEGWVGV
jgi:MSHA biogenesis protein MshJ